MSTLKKQYHEFKVSVRFYEELGCTYMNMPKAGCSSIKTGIAKKHKNPKKLKIHQNNTDSTFVEMGENFLSSFKFTFVRNPFKRVVSAYNSKILMKSDNIWKLFFNENKINLNIDLSFEYFLLLLQKQKIYNIDPHFRPQTALMCKDFIAYDFIGHLENIKEDIAFVSDYVDLPKRKLNPTNEGISIKDLSAQDIDIILDIYKDDFALLSYDTDINNLMPNKEKLSSLFFEKTEEKEKRLRQIVAHAKRPKFIRSCMHRIF